MKLIKILIALALLLLIVMPKTSAMDERDKNLNLQLFPFSGIIDWREEEQRQKYDTILAEKYKIESYSVLYQSNKRMIKDPWYDNENFKIISDRAGNIKGYILSFENITVPILFYKQKTDDDKPKLTYARTDTFEIISDINGKKIKLNSFDVVSLNWGKKLIGGAIGYAVEETRGIFKEKPQEGYDYCQSTKEMLAFLENHFEIIKNSWRQYLYENYLRIHVGERYEDTKPGWADDIVMAMGNRLERYEDIKSQIKAEVKQFGGDNWEKIMRDIQKKWPAMK